VTCGSGPQDSLTAILTTIEILEEQNKITKLKNTQADYHLDNYLRTEILD